MNIYVSKLNFRTTGESLQALSHNTERYLRLTSSQTGRPDVRAVSALSEMPDEGQGQSAIDALNGTDFEGMTIIVNVARPKTEHGNGGGYGGNRGGGGYNRDGYGKRRF